MKTKLILIMCCFALAVFGLAGPVYADDGCSKDVRTALPNCASWSSDKKDGKHKITVKNDCSYKMQAKVDMAPTWSCWGGYDTDITIEANHKNSSDWVCGSISGVYCCKGWWDSDECPDE